MAFWARTRPLGARGERAAARFLRRRSYRIVASNVRIPAGEVDLVALAPDRRTIVIVEVKTRAGDADGDLPPEMSVTAAKRRKLLSLAEQLADRNGWADRPMRIDVVSVTWPKRGRSWGRPVIRHFEDAVGETASTIRPVHGVRRASRGKPFRA